MTNAFQGYEMVSFDTVSVPPPVEDPDEKKEVGSSSSAFLSFGGGELAIELRS